MSTLRKVYRRVNDQFSEKLGAAFTEKFQLKVTTSWNIVSTALQTHREDDRPLTKEQHNWISGYSEGYGAAMGQITVKPDGSRA